MSIAGLKALVLGASGLIGTDLVQLLLADPRYEQVYIVVRKPMAIRHPKLHQIIADFHSITAQIESLQIDHLYSCLGSTRKKTPDTTAYYQIDHDYPLRVAQLLKANGCEAMALVSSIGASTASKNFYLQLKGTVEKSIKELNFNTLCIFQPSFLVGKRKESRLVESIGIKIMAFINPFLRGKSINYRSIESSTVASGMITSLNSKTAGIFIYKTSDIKNLT